ncbi:TraB/VirB10 family protein [Enterovibrio paralichthyis]|uniref:TraB/VirB10 family protein n=1 Tax=Enterovibrio paralichthyis TaxID=2853805 RepID=UPI001C480440|nr:TraB/VirB10 family protein [Enterovibrio paralichthyis]MBV7300269.1 TraB/VirB10 family protein [Enterovibrio paralichthyis]
MLLFLFVAIVGGGGYIWVSAAPQTQTTRSEKTDLDKRLEAATGQNRHPSLTGRRDYDRDYQMQNEVEQDRLKSEIAALQQEVQQKEETVAGLQTQFQKFLDLYAQDQAQREARDLDLLTRLDADAEARTQLEAQINQSKSPASGVTATGWPTKAPPQQPVGSPRDSRTRNQGTTTTAPPTQKGLTRKQFQLVEANFNAAKKVMSVDNYLPAGSYAEGRIIVGVKASAAVDAQNDPRPITIRVRGKARGPVWRNDNLEADTDGCTITGSAYGDISSEQGHAKLHEMSCAVGPNEVTTTRVYGYLAHKGMYGIHGKVVMREGDLVERAFWASLLTSSGTAVDTLVGTSSQSAFGTVNSSGGAADAARELVAGGLKGSGEQLGRYYMKRLEQIQPVIPLKAGTDVTIVFMKGVYLDGTDEKDVKTANKSRIPLDEKGSDIAPDAVNGQLIDLLKRTGQTEATRTDWNTELYQ